MNDARRELNAHISLLRSLLPPQWLVGRSASCLVAVPAPWLTEGHTEQDNHLRALLDKLTDRELNEEPAYTSGSRALIPYTIRASLLSIAQSPTVLIVGISDKKKVVSSFPNL